MKKVAKKSVKKYGVGGTNGTPKKDSMPVPSKQVRSGEGRGPRKYTFGNSDVPGNVYDMVKDVNRRREEDYKLYKLEQNAKNKNSMQKQKKGGSVKRKTK